MDWNFLSFIISLTLDKHLYLSSLPYFPEISGDVEEAGLEEEAEADPLVVFVVSQSFLIFLISSSGRGEDDGTHATMGLIHAERLATQWNTETSSSLPSLLSSPLIISSSDVL